MATYDLEEQEQLDEIKVWWKQYGGLVINLLTAAALTAAAWQGWNAYQRSQTGQAAAVYSVLQVAVDSKDTQKIKAATGELLDKFGGTQYATMGALVTAKAMLDAGDVKTAQAQLQWAVANGKNELRELARLRLAAVMLDGKEYDAALKQLDGDVSAGFEVLFAASRGDVFFAQGKKAEARTAYQAALDKISAAEKLDKVKNSAQEGQANAAYRWLVQQKLDALGGE